MNLFILSLYSYRHKREEIMIIDNIKNASLYYNIHKRFKMAFDFLETIDLNNAVEGTFEVDGSNIKSIISTNELKDKSDAILETHRKYIDIHIPISENETFGWKSAKELVASAGKYDSENDFELFYDNPTTFFTIPPRTFAIFLLEDAHAPLIGSGKLKKIIFKIAID